jgi:hypothetical protein
LWGRNSPFPKKREMNWNWGNNVKIQSDTIRQTYGGKNVMLRVKQGRYVNIWHYLRIWNVTQIMKYHMEYTQ